MSTTRTRPRPERTLVAGLGNLLLQDDGVGVHAVRALRKILPPRVVVAEVGTAVLDGLHLFEWADTIVAIDAMQAGGRPGTLYSFGVEDVDAGGATTSLHEVSLVSALRFLRKPHRPRIRILGVEPESIAFGTELSGTVAAALPHVVEAARRVALGIEDGARVSGQERTITGASCAPER